MEKDPLKWMQAIKRGNICLFCVVAYQTLNSLGIFALAVTYDAYGLLYGAFLELILAFYWGYMWGVIRKKPTFFRYFWVTMAFLGFSMFSIGANFISDRYNDVMIRAVFSIPVLGFMIAGVFGAHKLEKA